MNTPTIETERLILRKFTLDDLEAIYQIYSDEEVNRFLPWFPLETGSRQGGCLRKNMRPCMPCRGPVPMRSA